MKLKGGSKRDEYYKFVTFQNSAVCYHKLGLLEECMIYLKECIKIISLRDEDKNKMPSFYKENDISCIKLIDFGLSKQLSENELMNTPNGTVRPLLLILLSPTILPQKF